MKFGAGSEGGLDLATMAEALREAVEHFGGRATRDQIRNYLDETYPNQWKPGTLTAHLYGCAVNNPKAFTHHPSLPKFLFRLDADTFEMYDPKKHGEILPAAAQDHDDMEPTAEEAVEVSVSLERDLEEYLSMSLPTLEPKLELVERQYKTGVGIIDILAKDRNGDPVVIEIKAGEARDPAIGQISGYLAWLGKNRPFGARVRGMLIAAGFSERAKYASESVANLRLLRFIVKFEFESIAA
jgi:hypothetical protein